MDSGEIAARFHEDGFVVVRGLLPLEFVRGIEAEVEAYIGRIAPRLAAGEVYYEDSPARPVKAMHGMDRHSGFFKDLGGNPALLGIARAIWPEGEIIPGAVSYFGKPARDGSVTPAHQDNFFQHWDPPLALTATIAIDASTAENGALVCARGSHRQFLPHHPSGVMGFSMTLDEPVDSARFPEVQLCLRPGDVAFHHIAVVHRSDANRSDRPRWQLALGYRSSLARKNEAAAARHAAMLAALHASGKEEAAGRG